VARRCVFCGHGPLTREHVIPRWLTEVLHEQERFRGHDQQVILSPPKAARSRLLLPHHEMRESFNAMTVKAVLHPTPAPAWPIPPTWDRALPHRRDRARRSNRVRGPGGRSAPFARRLQWSYATRAPSLQATWERGRPGHHGEPLQRRRGRRGQHLRELQAMDLTVRSRPRWRLPYQVGEPACRQVEPVRR
jgi:hypothetical protein